MTKILLTNRRRAKNKIRKKITWTSERPRLSVFRSNAKIYLQLIDDSKWSTLTSAWWLRTIKWAESAWAEIAKNAKVKTVVFDRNWYKYLWVVKAVAESARKWWLQF